MQEAAKWKRVKAFAQKHFQSLFLSFVGLKRKVHLCLAARAELTSRSSELKSDRDLAADLALKLTPTLKMKRQTLWEIEIKGALSASQPHK